MKTYYVRLGPTIYFKAFDPNLKEVKWTAKISRAASWKDPECAEDQAFYLNMLDDEVEWTVQVIDE